MDGTEILKGITGGQRWFYNQGWYGQYRNIEGDNRGQRWFYNQGWYL